MVIKMKILIIGARGGIAYQAAQLLMSKNHFVYLAVHTKEQKRNLLKYVKNIIFQQ